MRHLIIVKEMLSGRLTWNVSQLEDILAFIGAPPSFNIIWHIYFFIKVNVEFSVEIDFAGGKNGRKQVFVLVRLLLILQR